jgi:hypothetical protein
MTLEDFKRFYLDQPNVLIPTQEEMLDYVDGWIDERDQLQARVADLWDALSDLKGTVVAGVTDHADVRAANAALDRHPRQSLYRLKVQVLREFMQQVAGNREAYEAAEREINRIEQQAEGE